MVSHTQVTGLFDLLDAQGSYDLVHNIWPDHEIVDSLTQIFTTPMAWTNVTGTVRYLWTFFSFSPLFLCQLSIIILTCEQGQSKLYSEGYCSSQSCRGGDAGR